MLRLGLVLLLLVSAVVTASAQRALPRANDATQALATLQGEYQAALDAYLGPYTRATSDEERERITLDPAQHPGHAFLPRFERLAAEQGGSELALGARLQVLELADLVSGTTGKAAIERTVGELFALHAASSELYRFVDWLRFGHAGFDSSWARAQAERVKGASPDPVVRGIATLAIAETLWLEARERRDAALDLQATDMLRAGIELLRPLAGAVAAEHRAQAEGFLFKLEHLRIGKPFPEIEGQDASGARFKLSDYRGKVTVIEFWGLW